jgi:hypothetical protein
MKKKVLFVASLFLATATFAQDGLTSKKGEAFLPEAGDWAIGFNGNPFLDYAGNWFNGTTNNSVSATWMGNNPPMTLVGKMYKDETTAYRMKLRIGFGSMTDENIIDTSNTTLTGEITDEMKTSHMMITLGGGIEKRKGNTRIQGFYGGEMLLSFGSSGNEFTYADAGSGFSSALPTSTLHTASYTDWSSWDPSLGNVGNAVMVTNNNERTTKISNGSTFMLQIRGFAGVEWFLAPKVSVAAEYGWGLMMSSTGQGERDTQSYEDATGVAPGNESTIERKHTTGKHSEFGIDTDNNGGEIHIYFHF